MSDNLLWKSVQPGALACPAEKPSRPFSGLPGWSAPMLGGEGESLSALPLPMVASYAPRLPPQSSSSSLERPVGPTASGHGAPGHSCPKCEKERKKREGAHLFYSGTAVDIGAKVLDPKSLALGAKAGRLAENVGATRVVLPIVAGHASMIGKLGSAASMGSKFLGITGTALGVGSDLVAHGVPQTKADAGAVATKFGIEAVPIAGTIAAFSGISASAADWISGSTRYADEEWKRGTNDDTLEQEQKKAAEFGAEQKAMRLEAERRDSAAMAEMMPKKL